MLSELKFVGFYEFFKCVGQTKLSIKWFYKTFFPIQRLIC